MCRHTALTLSLCVALQVPSLTQTSGDGREVNAGTVIEGELLRHTFTIADVPPGTAIERVEVDQPGLSARFRRVPDRSGAPQVRLEWDTSRIAEPGPLEGHGTIIWVDRTHAPVRVTLRATVRPAFIVKPAPALFFSVFQGETKTDRLRLDVAEGLSIGIERLEPVGTHFQAAVETLQAGRQYDLVVTVPANATTGRFRERVVLHTTHPIARTLAVPVNVFVKPDVYANPETIDFGELPLGLLAREPSRLAQRTETIIVRRRQGPFSIEEITCDVAGLSIVRDPAEGTSEAFRIDVSPEPRSLSPGKTLTGTITIRTNDSRFPELRVPVSAVPKP